MTDEKEEKGFTVVDRRIKADEEEKEPGAGNGVEKDPAPEHEKTAPPAEDTKDPGQALPVSFPAFLLSLHASALIHLGVLPVPGADDKSLDRAAARQNIDLLEVLKDKTQGNLTPEENQLLDNILYELRMIYLQACRASGPKECKE